MYSANPIYHFKGAFSLATFLWTIATPFSLNTQYTLASDIVPSAAHKRDRRRHAYSTHAAHIPEKHLKYVEQRGWDAAYFRRQAGKIDPATGWAIEHILTSKQLIEQTYNACLGVLRLKDKYGSDRLEAACARAQSTHRVTYGILQNILKNGTDRLPLKREQNLFTIPGHDNIRGASHYE